MSYLKGHASLRETESKPAKMEYLGNFMKNMKI
jgi:hypothetical protein